MALGLLAALSGCESSDPTAPADTTITVSANPQTVTVPVGQQGTTQITATLRSKNGTRLPDQELTFSTTAGNLDPIAETPLSTDDNGQATSTLITPSSATITARSGSITGMTQVQASACDLTQYLLNVEPGEFKTCSTPLLTLTATVLDTNGDPCPFVTVIFEQQAGGTLTGEFDPGGTTSQTSSDENGLAVVTWSASECDSLCKDKDCGSLFFTARDSVGTFESAPAEVIDGR